MKNWQKILLSTTKVGMATKVALLTSVMLLSGCSWFQTQEIKVISNECGWYESYKMTCNKDKVPEGTKCSEIISRQTQEDHDLNEQMFKLKCL